MRCVFRTVLRNTILHTIGSRRCPPKRHVLTRDNVVLSRVTRLVIA